MGEQRTSIPQPTALVVVVGGPAELVEAARHAAGVAVGAKVELAELGTAATVVASHRPFAIVMSEDVYAFDATEFDALARDVGATLVLIDATNSSRSDLERVLMPKLGRAHRRKV